MEQAENLCLKLRLGVNLDMSSSMRVFLHFFYDHPHVFSSILQQNQLFHVQQVVLAEISNRCLNSIPPFLLILHFPVSIIIIADSFPSVLLENAGSQEVQPVLENIDLCSNHKDCEARRDQIKMTKGFIVKESVKGHMVSSFLLTKLVIVLLYCISMVT